MIRDNNPRHWKFLVFYYNPDQRRLFVAKRYGTPLTLNFARPMAWAITAMVLAIPTVGSVLIKLHFIR
jgi:uncharacterized membrane protein